MKCLYRGISLAERAAHYNHSAEIFVLWVNLLHLGIPGLRVPLYIQLQRTFSSISWKDHVHRFLSFISSLQDYYSPAMLGLKTDQEVLGELVKMKVPAVAELMERHGVMWTLVVSRWFICLFIDILPVEVTGNINSSYYTPDYFICTALVIAYWKSRLIWILSFTADCAPNMGLFILWRVKDHLPCGLNID